MSSSGQTQRARRAAGRGAQVVTRTPLLYARGADPLVDRPAHVRAGSALASWDGHLAIIQDDACFLAIVDVRAGVVRDVAFPGEGPRQFDDGRGNKRLKLDLEAAFITPDATLLVALGSGSTALRERVVLVDRPSSEEPVVSIATAHELYAILRSEASFAGSELNVEGAVVVGDDLVLFQRGNGAPVAGRAPVDATARIALAPLLAYLRGGGPVPPLRDVTGWDLGDVDGHRLTFTDGALAPSGAVAFLACAEDSPDVTRDGPVAGVVLGRIDLDRRTAELDLVLDERGAPLLDKAEGLAFDPADPTRAFVVTDRDDPAAPADLLTIRLGEAWLS
jgi:hypothetical protein